VNGWARITVSDTGPGIPAEDLPHVFERFYRVDKARTRAQGGAGLGLAIARRIVQIHGGRIEAASTGVPGQGATFSVWLPLANGR
jgi:signal transduction histidine kinase